MPSLYKSSHNFHEESTYENNDKMARTISQMAIILEQLTKDDDANTKK